MFDGPGGTDCDKVRFPVHGCWKSRDVGVFDCQRVYEICNVLDHLVCCLGPKLNTTEQ